MFQYFNFVDSAMDEVISCHTIELTNYYPLDRIGDLATPDVNRVRKVTDLFRDGWAAFS